MSSLLVLFSSNVVMVFFKVKNKPTKKADRYEVFAASYDVAYEIATHSKPFSDGEFIKDCIEKCVRRICPEYLDQFKSMCLSRRTIGRRIQAMASDVEEQLLGVVSKFEFFSVALDECRDIQDKEQLLIFIRGVR